MTTRTTRSQVAFSSPFVLAEIDGLLAPGTYDIDTDERAIEGIERTAYIRTATLIHIRTTGRTRTVTIDPSGLAAALRNDKGTVIPISQPNLDR